MQIGAYTDCLGQMPFEAIRFGKTALDWCAANGLAGVELGTGNFSPAPHCDLAELLHNSRLGKAAWLGKAARLGKAAWLGPLSRRRSPSAECSFLP